MIRDLREALRTLATRPGFAAAIVVTLALAIGVNSTIFSAVYRIVLSPLDYPAPDQLAVLWENNPELGLEREPVSAATYLDWRERSRTLVEIAAYRYRGFTLLQDDQPIRIASVETTPALFRVLQVPPALGRVFAQEEERPGNERLVILSHASWMRRFGGDSAVVGRSIQLDGEAYAVVGIMPDGFAFPAGDPTVEAWTPLTLSLDALPSRPHRMYQSIARLAPRTSFERVRQEMRTVGAGIAEENPESNAGWGIAVVPAREQLVGSFRLTALFLFGAVLLVLLIGCVNIANLLLARSTDTAREFGVRAALGASGRALLRRSLAESLVLAVLGGIAGAVFAYGGVAVLRGVLPAEVPRAHEIRLDVVALGFTAVVSLLAGLAFGWVPAVRAMRPDVRTVLHEGGSRLSPSRRSRWLTNALVVAQVALALILLIGAGSLARSFLALTSVDPGFRSSDVTTVVFSLPESRYDEFPARRQFFLDLVERVDALPAVTTAGAVTALPMSRVGTDFEVPFTITGLEAASPSERPRADYRGVVPSYFETMGIPLLQGRVFDRLDGAEDRLRTVIINDALRERYFPDRNPIGQTVARMPMFGDLEIVGVVGNVRHGGLDTEARPEVFVPFQQLPLSEMHVVVRSADAWTDVVRRVAAEARTLDPQLPVTTAAALEDLVAASVAQPKFNMVLMLGLAICAAGLAAIGIYGVVSYAVARRTAEIGVRMALGAGQGETIWLVLGQVLRVVGLGVVLGLAGSAAASRLLQRFLYGVTATDLMTLLPITAGLVLVGVMAALLPARRAAAIDPVIALRE